MVLFRHISLRERWARHLPSWGEVLAVAVFFVACAVVLDYLRGGVTRRAVVEADTEACVERLARADPQARRQTLRNVCAARLSGAPGGPG